LRLGRTPGDVVQCRRVIKLVKRDQIGQDIPELRLVITAFLPYLSDNAMRIGNEW
jgi:hypothetical protein